MNGQRVTKLATRVGPKDSVSIGGKKVNAERPLTAMLHKPKGYICSTVEEGGAKTIYDLLPPEWPRVFYIGRLDMDSEGLLLLTNNGDLAQKLSHPSYKLPKIYEVRLNREFDFADTDKLRNGMLLEGKLGRFDAIHRLSSHVYKVVLSQGLKRQIRLMFEAIGYNVERLIRTQIGSLSLGDLPPGKWKIINEYDVERLCTASPDAPVVKHGDGSARPIVASERPRPFRPRPPRAGAGTGPSSLERPRRFGPRPTGDHRPARPGDARSADRGERRPARPYGAGGDSRPARPGEYPGSRPFRPRRPADAAEGERGPRRPSFPRRPYGAAGDSRPARPGEFKAGGRPPFRPRRSADGQAGEGRPTFSRGPQGPAGRRRPSSGGGPSSGPRRGRPGGGGQFRSGPPRRRES